MITAHKALTRDAGSCNACSEPSEVVIVVRVASNPDGLSTETRFCRRCAQQLWGTVSYAIKQPAPVSK